MIDEMYRRRSASSKLRDFLDAEVSRFDFNYLVILYAPGPKKPWEYKNMERWVAAMQESLNDNLNSARTKRYEKAHLLALKWIAEVGRKGGKDFHYVMAIDDRKMKRDFVFHVALRGNWGTWDMDDYYAPRWKEMSGGVAFVQRVNDWDDEVVRRKFWNLVVHKHCAIQLRNGTLLDSSQLYPE